MCCVPRTNAVTLVGQLSGPASMPGRHCITQESIQTEIFKPTQNSSPLIRSRDWRLLLLSPWPAVVRCFIPLGSWTLGLGRSSASITFPHLPTAKKIFLSNVPTLCAVVLGGLVTSLYFAQRHHWETLFLWIFFPDSFIQVLFTFFHLSLFLGYLLKHH